MYNKIKLDILPFDKENEPTSFWIIARRHYKIVRFAFENRSCEASLLLAQQSFELYIKWILLINSIKPFLGGKKGHDLIENLKLWEDIDCFQVLLNNSSYENILKLLGDYFLNIRYGNHKGIKFGSGFFNDLDSIEIILDKCFFETMKAKNPTIHFKDWSFEEYRLKHSNKDRPLISSEF